MRLAILFLPGLSSALALAGCDRQEAPAPQGNGADAVQGAAPAPGGGAPGGNTAHARYPTGRLDRSHAGTMAPELAFEAPDGSLTRLSAFRGRPLLVNLWATWCGPCIVEMPSLDALAERQGESGVQVLAVSQDTARQKVTDFFAARSFRHLQPHLDKEMSLMTALRLDTLPTTILYNASGREVWRMTGMAEWGDARTTRLLGEAAASD